MWIYFPKFVVSKLIDVFFLSYWTKAASGQMNANQLCDRPWNSNFSKTNFNHLRHLLSIYFTYILVKRATIYRFSIKLKKKKIQKKPHTYRGPFSTSGLRPATCSFIKTESTKQEFFCKLCKIFYDSFFRTFPRDCFYRKCHNMTAVNKNAHCTWTETSLKVSGPVAELQMLYSYDFFYFQ